MRSDSTLEKEMNHWFLKHGDTIVVTDTKVVGHAEDYRVTITIFYKSSLPNGPANR